MRSLFRALTVAALCVDRTANRRPDITAVVDALTQISESQSSRKRWSSRLQSSVGSSASTEPRIEDWNQAKDQGEGS